MLTNGDDLAPLAQHVVDELVSLCACLAVSCMLIQPLNNGYVLVIYKATLNAQSSIDGAVQVKFDEASVVMCLVDRLCD